MQYVGAGKVLFHATDETWRWRYRVGDVFFARYWVQTIRYLSRSKLLGKDRSAELTADRREYRRGETVRLRVRFVDERQAPADDDGVTVVLEQRRRSRIAASNSSATPPAAACSRACSATRPTASTTPGSPRPRSKAGPGGRFSGRGAAGRIRARANGRRRTEAASGDTKGRFYTMATASKLLRRSAPGPPGADRSRCPPLRCGTSGLCCSSYFRCWSANGFSANARECYNRGRSTDR